MKPVEIAQIKKRSMVLEAALRYKTGRALWLFLRERVASNHGYYCEQCERVFYPTLKSPYNAPDTGWCIDCIVYGFNTNMPRYISPQEIEGERRYERECNVWGPPEMPEGYDGPPILWS